MKLHIKRLTETAKLPTRATDGSAGYDLYADEFVTLPSHHGQRLVSTGIAVAIPAGCCGQIWPRSGMDVKAQVTRGAGLIDWDYRGEVKVLLINRGAQHHGVRRGDRIGQLVILPILTPEVVEVDCLDGTARGDGGFGSSGA
jgi:dUTP pyrophosphatase